MTSTTGPAVGAHPLDPLDSDEFRRVVEVVAAARGVGDGWRYASIELREPAKEELAAFRPGEPLRRTATAVLWNRADSGRGGGVGAAAGGVGDGWGSASIELREPAKEELAAFRPGEPLRRTATAVLWNRADGAAYRAVVSLTDAALLAWEPLPGVQP